MQKPLEVALLAHLTYKSPLLYVSSRPQRRAALRLYEQGLVNLIILNDTYLIKRKLKREVLYGN